MIARLSLLLVLQLVLVFLSACGTDSSKISWSPTRVRVTDVDGNPLENAFVAVRFGCQEHFNPVDSRAWTTAAVSQSGVTDATGMVELPVGAPPPGSARARVDGSSCEKRVYTYKDGYCPVIDFYSNCFHTPPDEFCPSSEYYHCLERAESKSLTSRYTGVSGTLIATDPRATSTAIPATRGSVDLELREIPPRSKIGDISREVIDSFRGGWPSGHIRGLIYFLVVSSSRKDLDAGERQNIENALLHFLLHAPAPPHENDNSFQREHVIEVALNGLKNSGDIAKARALLCKLQAQRSGPLGSSRVKESLRTLAPGC